MDKSKHTTVLLHEAVDALQVTRDGVYVDVTLGAGGHTKEILAQFDNSNVLISLDADQTALDQYSGESHKGSHHLVHSNFSQMLPVLNERDIDAVDGILADLGWRTEQFTAGGRGFSFQVDEPLHMTYGDPEDYAFTAQDVVNDWAEEDIANVIYAYGEERAARKIAKAIVIARKQQRIETSFQLVDVITQVIKPNYRIRINPATKTFQALRIVVNDELSLVEQLINDSFSILKPEGHLAIITFHSLEDRIVKHQFRSLAAEGRARVITKKPITPTKEETTENPRARSGKLRIIEKL